MKKTHPLLKKFDERMEKGLRFSAIDRSEAVLTLRGPQIYELIGRLDEAHSILRTRNKGVAERLHNVLQEVKRSTRRQAVVVPEPQPRARWYTRLWRVAREG